MRSIWTRIIKTMNEVGQGIDNAMVRTAAIFDTLHTDLATVICKGPRAACENLINLINVLVGDCTVTSPLTTAADADLSAPTSKVVTLRESLLVDIDTSPSFKTSAAFNTELSELMGDVSPSAQSTSHSPSHLAPAVSSDDRPLVPDGPSAPKAVSVDFVMSSPVAGSMVALDAKSTSGIQSSASGCPAVHVLCVSRDG